MKQIKIVLLMVFLTGLCSCRKNLLDVKPNNLLTEAQIVSNDATVTAWFAALYRDLPMEDFSFEAGSFWRFPDGGGKYTYDWSDETAAAATYSMASNSGQTVYDVIYKAIRNINVFIKLVGAAPNFTAAQQAQYVAEAKFCRAYCYFGLVKYYGGVPIVLDIPANPVPLPRNKEQEVYDQIKKDLDEAAAGMPAVLPGFLNTPTVVNGISYSYGRANKYACLALQSRAMIHGGSIGLFGDPAVFTATNGVNGVDPAHAQVYIQSAYDASKAVMDSHVFSLYSKYAAPGIATPANAADYAKNFQYLFYDTKQGDTNSESILNRGYDYATSGDPSHLGYTHSQDLTVLPDYIKSAVGYGNAEKASLDLMEKFENIDGSDSHIGTYAVGIGANPPPAPGAVGTQYHYPSMTAPFVNRDPRYHGTLVSNGTFFRTAIITVQKGVITGGANIAAGTTKNGSALNQFVDTKVGSSAYLTFQIDPSKFPAGDTYVIGTGNSGNGDQVCFLKKWTDPVSDITLIRDYTSRTSWMDLRYGEVVMNFVESSFDLGKPAAEQITAINLIRARAGVPPVSSISQAIIRHERNVEVSYENKTWWDYLRWRCFPTDFTSRQQFNIQCYWDIDTNDYVYIRVNGSNRTLDTKYYYADIPASDASTDPLLIPSHNPRY